MSQGGVEKRLPHRLRENGNVPSVRAFCPLRFSGWVASVGPALTVGKLFAGCAAETEHCICKLLAKDTSGSTRNSEAHN
jgi:hypothetical protein